MKVNGTGSLGAAGGAAKSRSAADGQGFSVGAGHAPSSVVQMTRAAPMAGVMSVDALLALQDIGGPLERRRRAMGRAGKILDVLDGVKLSLLSGESTEAGLRALQGAVRDQREATDDPGLEGVLNEIETRAAVELAKREASLTQG